MRGCRLDLHGGDESVEVRFPEVSGVVVGGTDRIEVLHLLECLFSREFCIGSYCFDEGCGFEYDSDYGLCRLDFESGFVSYDAERGGFKVCGDLPNLHIVRYLHDGYVRSTLVGGITSSKEGNFTDFSIDLDMHVHSSMLSDVAWWRICGVTNTLLGYTAVEYRGGGISFHFLPLRYFSIDAQRLVYLLVSECMLTPTGYHRILLLSDLDYFVKGRQQAVVFSKLCTLPRHSYGVSAGDISSSDMESLGGVIGFLHL